MESTPKEKVWTVVLHFDRDQTQIITGLTREQAERHLHVGVFVNQDCVNAQVFRTSK
jgi:hypothetical protein